MVKAQHNSATHFYAAVSHPNPWLTAWPMAKPSGSTALLTNSPPIPTSSWPL
jgi:hypothetical protein